MTIRTYSGMIRVRTVLISLAIGALAVASSLAYRRKFTSQPGESAAAATSSATIQRLFENGLDSLTNALVAFDNVAENGNIATLRTSFRAARLAYKLQETLLAENGPSTAGVLNGPLPEDDDGPPQPLGQPAAFQRIEAIIFENDSLSAQQRSEIRGNISVMRKSVVALRKLTPYFGLTEAHVANSMRTELARITILGFAGFDSDQSGDAIVESGRALNGMAVLAKTAAAAFQHRAMWTALRDTILAAQLALQG
ncbi:MAG: hypothetical protein ABI852_04350, partial [Gemmatimonadaceae bacterium]